MTDRTLRSRWVAAAQPFTIALLALFAACDSDPTDPQASAEVAEARRRPRATPTSTTTDLPYAPAPPSPTRTVRVTSQGALLSAAAAAQPGDLIDIAPGTYVGGVQLAIGKGGTRDRPIVFRCQPGAVIDRGGRSTGYGFRIRGPYVQVRGCTIRNAQFLIALERGSGGPEPTDVVISDNVLRDGYQNAIVLQSAHRAYVQRNTISYISGSRWVEGIYGGHSADASRMSNDVMVLGNTFGPYISGEHVDVKGLSSARSSRWLIAGNYSNATGTLARTTPNVDGVLSDQGCAGCRWENNRVENMRSAGLNGFFFYTSQGSVARANVVDPSRNYISSAYGYRVGSSRTTASIACSNVGTRNVGCTQ